ncbi:MAG: hypothetical protein K6F50_04505 [Kiritimatiellae bacterium]|nr:hypothetical protein [Kiritimatiellia bacterium]
MNIDFNAKAANTSNIVNTSPALEAGKAAAAKTASAGRGTDLSITTAAGMAPGEIPDIDFPEDENAARNDHLGELVKAAFNLPAPPADFMNRTV